MSFSTTTNKSATYTGNASTTAFTWSFLIYAASDLKVYLDGVLQSSGYSVSGLGSTSGGTVTFSSAPGSGVKVQIFRTVPLTQLTDYVENTKFPADSHEQAVDRAIMASQQLEEELSRTPQLAIDTTATLPAVFPAPTASTLIQWNSAGNALENSAAVIGTLATQAADAVNIDGGNIDGTTIGGSSAAAGTFTTLTATTSNLGTLGAAVNANNQNITNIDVDSGAIDGTVIGGSSAAAGTFTTATATTKVVTPEVEATGTALQIDQRKGGNQGALSLTAWNFDLNAGGTCTIDNENTSNGVRIGAGVNGSKVFLGHTNSETTVNDNLYVTGDLIVNGTTTTVNSTTISVDDKNIELGSVASPSDSTADGGGITLKGASDKTIIWDNSSDAWSANQHLNISTGKSFRVASQDVLNATTLGSGVVNSSLTSTGTLTGLTVSGATALNGNVVLGDAAADTITVGGTLQTATPLVFEGGTANSHETTLGITDPTADRTITLPDETGTVITTASTVAVAGGGTGQTSYTNGQLLIGNTTGNTLAKGTISGGTGIQVNVGTGTIEIVNTGNAAQADMNGSELILDADGDTSITADTDDQIDIKIANADDFQFTANTFTVLSGSTLTVASGATIANSGTATGFGPTLSGSSNNQIVTVTGANAMQGEANLSFDGSKLMVTDQSAFTPLGIIHSRGGSSGVSAINTGYDELVLEENGNSGLSILSGEADIGGILFGDASDADIGGIYYHHNGNSMRFTVNAAEKMRIHSGGLVSFNNGIELGSGLDATAANTLDDYEEGTFTPTIQGQAGASGQSYSNQFGTYTKVGRLVALHGYVILSNKGTISGNYIALGGFPFANMGSGADGGHCGVSRVEKMAVSSGYIGPDFQFGSGSSLVIAMEHPANGSAGGHRALNNDYGTPTDAIANDTAIAYSCTYMTA